MDEYNPKIDKIGAYRDENTNLAQENAELRAKCRNNSKNCARAFALGFVGAYLLFIAVSHVPVVLRLINT